MKCCPICLVDGLSFLFRLLLLLLRCPPYGHHLNAAIHLRHSTRSTIQFRTRTHSELFGCTCCELFLMVRSLKLKCKFSNWEGAEEERERTMKTCYSIFAVRLNRPLDFVRSSTTWGGRSSIQFYVCFDCESINNETAMTPQVTLIELLGYSLEATNCFRHYFFDFFDNQSIAQWLNDRAMLFGKECQSRRVCIFCISNIKFERNSFWIQFQSTRSHPGRSWRTA